MSGRGFNRADGTLLVAAALFLLAVYLRLRFPGNVPARAFLFAAEAALVGGAADWFAVTALFEKPWGFPYHTAILPRRRKEFMEAAVRLIQREFFSRRRLFSLMERYDWRGALLPWVRSDAFRSWLRDIVAMFLCRYALAADVRPAAREVAASLRHDLLRVPLSDVLGRLRDWLRAGENDRRLLARVAAYLREGASSPAFRQEIEVLLQGIQEKKLEGMGAMAAFLASLAQAMDIVNVGELAALIQRQILRVLDEAGEPGSKLQETIRELFYRQLALAGEDAGAAAAFAAIRGEMLRAVPLEEALAAIFREMQRGLSGGPADASFPPGVARCLEQELDRVFTLWDDDEGLRSQFDGLVYDLVARSALQAQAMSGLVAREVMARLTDEQLNHIVYDKVEPDMLWIRMNGSIVGAVIGLLLFLILEFWGRFF